MGAGGGAEGVFGWKSIYLNIKNGFFGSEDAGLGSVFVPFVHI